MSRGWRLSLLLLLPLLALGQSASTGITATVPSGGGRPAIELVDQPAWVEPGADVALDLRVRGRQPGLEVAATVRRPVRSRSEFQLAVAGTHTGAVVGVRSSPLDGLPTPEGQPADVVRLSFQPAPPATPPGEEPPPPPAGVVLADRGVYPVQVELRQTGSEVLDQFVTHVVVLERDALPTRLGVAWVIAPTGPVPWLPDGPTAPELVQAVTGEGELAATARALERVPGIPVTLAPGPAAIEAWALHAGSDTPTAEALAALRSQAASPTRQTVAGPYVSVDLTALAGEGLEGEIAAQLDRGARALEDWLGSPVDDQPYLARRVDEPALDVLRASGVGRLVLRAESLVPVFQNLTPARPFAVRSGDRRVTAAIADDDLAGLLSGDEPPGLRAHRFLAALVVVALELPAEERGVVVVSGDLRDPAAVIPEVLRGLDSHPGLAPVTLDAFFAETPTQEGQTAVRSLQDAPPGDLPVMAGAVRNARSRLASLAGMTEADASLAGTGERLLLLAESDRWEGSAGRRRAAGYLAGVERTIQAVLDGIELPASQSVTLTARRGAIPVTFVNAHDSTIVVAVHLRSDRLLFPRGDEHLVEVAPRGTTARFTVEARAAGSFPLAVSVTSPDGRLELGGFRLTIRSTVGSGVALALTVGAALFLAAWWGNHIVRSRRRRPDASVPRPRGSAAETP